MPNNYQQHLLNQADRSRVLERFVKGNLQPGEYARFGGISGGARALVVARIQQRLERPLLIVAPEAESAEAWFDDFEHFGLDGLLHFPMSETLPYEVEEPIIEIVARQYSTLYYLMRGEQARTTKSPKEESDPTPGASLRKSAPPLIVAPIEALQRKLPTRDNFEKLFLSFWWGEQFDIEEAAQRLVDMGYERQSMTETRGEFSIRGHIVDIFPPHFENPVRFDLFGDEIESIRFFDASTQRSLPKMGELERVVILPARTQSVAERLAHEGNELVSLIDWLPEDTLVILDMPERYDASLEQLDRIAAHNFEERTGGHAKPSDASVEDEWNKIKNNNGKRGAKSALPLAAPAPMELPAGPPLPPEKLFAKAAEIRRALNNFAQVLIPALDLQEEGDEHDPHTFRFGVSSFENIPSDMDHYVSLIRKKQREEFSVHVVCDNDGQVTRLNELMREHEIPSRQILSTTDLSAEFRPHDILEGYQEVVLVTGPLQTGFIFPDALLLIVTDREMFGRYKRRHVYRKAYKGKPVSSAEEMRPGDYVVHIDHGVGRFLGIRRQEIDGRAAELIEVEYAEGNKLLVPIENVNRLQKYSSVEGKAPTLDRMGGKRWMQRRKKSQEKIEEMAHELLDIYAQRALVGGYAFGSDTTWQQEFEESFVYTETPDQLRAIGEVKADMTEPRAMDRLLCGDVGFGKTEVAMRAAFKAVQEKKQVAVLVPTTILAQQHYSTFRERFAEYPIKIDVISRFRTDMEQAEIIKQVKYGAVDIIIGTHRLISADVQFSDLGLLIIDEEHRFGVRQKEKIKALRASVDILTLSATPIPRTLYMALSGLRDMSVINTPPRDRLPIRTRVIHFIPEEIEQAVLRELNRGGQIYFVHNRVQNITQVARRLQEIVPNAKVAVAHGQMHERELEKIMFDFIDRKYDILLATTIIESGLDIPNVNTIIINRADAFGLAQLYQLRGRVGRDVKRAYAYLIVPDGRPITDMAVKRLRAIEEFTELGTGFQVAMRDLEIRGTGNLLGSEQHGAIEAVGFDLYCQLLEEAVKRLRGQSRGEEDFNVEIKWGIPALLPAEYVPVESQRLAFYKRCAIARDTKDLEDFTEELRDRFGNLPTEARNLIAISTMRLLARKAFVDRVIGTPKGFKISPRGDFLAFFKDALLLRDDKEFRDSIRAKTNKPPSEPAKGNGLAGIINISAEPAGGLDNRSSVVFEVKKWNLEKGIELVINILKILGEEK